MSEKVIKPDLEFVNDVMRSGGESLKKCFQCATCSVVCNVTPEGNPFPRKEMVLAQWGQKEELFRNPDVWLCHQCSDCTAHCPRGAKPGEVLGAVRKLSIAHYSKPSFLAKMVGDGKFLIPLLALPVVYFLLILSHIGNLPFANVPLGEGGKVVFMNFMPLLPYVDGTFVTLAIFATAVLALGVKSYWGDLSKGAKPQGGLVDGIVDTLKEIIAHDRFGKCGVTSGRKIAHMLVFFGFVLLFLATVCAGAREWAPKLMGEGGASIEHMLFIPMKVLGNAGALALIIGFLMVMMNRTANAEKAGIGSYYDWLFIGLVAALGVTGMGAQVFRLMGVAPVAYTLYFAHLVTIFFLFFYAPYSKMAHMVYRTTAMVHANMTGRK